MEVMIGKTVSLHSRNGSNMVSHMKTTIKISDSLFKEARKVAQQERTTINALIEEALHKVISGRRRRKSKGFRLRKATFKGRGLQPNLAGATLDQILDISYERRGDNRCP
jgi:predicted DNA-binding ribbon-helix-helix protein